MSNREDVLRKLKGMLDAKGREATEELLEYYTDAFEGFSCDKLIWAIKQQSRVKSYGCPGPEDILSHLMPSEADENTEAVNAMGRLRHAVETENYDYISGDGVLQYLVKLEGGLERLGLMELKAYEFKIKQLEAEYKDHKKSPTALAHIELKEAGQPLMIQDLMAKMKLEVGK